MVENVSIALRVRGDDLDPDEVSRVLNHKPTFAAKKGLRTPTSTGQTRIQQTGVWLLNLPASETEPLDARIEALLRRLTPDVERWRKIGERYPVELCLGAHIDADNKEIWISPRHLQQLADRGIGLGIDIYCYGRAGGCSSP